MDKIEEIKFSKEQWYEFYEKEGSHFFQLESNALKAHGEDQKKLLYEIFGSSKTLIQTIGVVAGFGFTGLNFVKNLSLFVGGEALLFIAIFYGLFWTQKIYKTNFNSSSTEIGRIKKLFGERYNVFKKIYDKALSDLEKSNFKNDTEIFIPKSQIMDLQRQNDTLFLKLISEGKGVGFSNPFNLLMLSFATGGIVLLLSFLWKI